MHSPQTVAEWLRRLAKHEGVYTDDPADPGNWTGGICGSGTLLGTKYGIAANTYPDLDIKNLSLDQAAVIYCRDFIGPLGLDRFRDGVAFQFLDFSVNSGADRATKELQHAVNAKADGVIGPKTVAALASVTESDLIMLYVAARIDFMTGLKIWPVYGRGWMRRIADNLRFGAEDS